MTAKRKVIAYTKGQRIPESLSNFMPMCREGYTKAAIIFKEEINRCQLEPNAICKALNNHPMTVHTFKPLRPLTHGVSILATDYLGNQSVIEITEMSERP